MCTSLLNGKYASSTLTSVRCTKKNGLTAAGTTGANVTSPSASCLIATTSGRDEVAHQHARAGDPDEQIEREVVLEERQEAEAAVGQAPHQQVAERRQDHEVGHVDDRQPDLEEPVHRANRVDPGRRRLHEEPEVPEQHDQHRPVERQRGQPEPLLLAVDQAPQPAPRRRAVAVVAEGGDRLGRHRRLRVAEERPEQQHLERHPPDDAEARRGALEPARLDPGQRLLLAARGGDPERHRRPRPADHLHRQAHDEDREGGGRNPDPEQRPQRGDRPAGPGDRHQDRDDDE